ncbi:hypothetical protein KGP36_03125 [Patescibacteria group bacterium]|nr:hypothetical protein [Patescibacteria group bacterium]
MKTWLYADPHFGHQGVCDFLRHDGKKLRPWFDQQHMTEDMIRWYNEMVNDEDRVYILGDVAFNVRTMKEVVARLKGRKVLVPGNHDPNNLRKYIDGFDDVRGYVVKKGFILSHIPIHPGSLSRWRVNIHGHLHYNQVGVDYYDDPDSVSRPDPRYVCVSVEHTNFRPILLDEVLKKTGINFDEEVIRY